MRVPRGESLGLRTTDVAGTGIQLDTSRRRRLGGYGFYPRLLVNDTNAFVRMRIRHPSLASHEAFERGLEIRKYRQEPTGETAREMMIIPPAQYPAVEASPGGGQLESCSERAQGYTA